jgi:hypothetical protein
MIDDFIKYSVLHFSAPASKSIISSQSGTTSLNSSADTIHDQRQNQKRSHEETAIALRDSNNTVETYFEELLFQIIIGGPLRSVPNSSDNLQLDSQVTSLCELDPIAGIFKMWMFDPNSPQLQENGQSFHSSHLSPTRIL